MMNAVEDLVQQTPEMGVFDQVSETEHEQIVFCYDRETGMKAIIGIHNTVLGPALGGTRLWNYDNEAAALTDVLRLSRGMTLKAAISGVNLGGGKAVIFKNDRTDNTEAFWRRYGKFVESLGGRYITAEDVGTSTEYMEYIADETDFVTGKPGYLGGGGDPSPVTAYGVYLGLIASLKKVRGSESLSNIKVAVQGTGHVGRYLIERLLKEGAKVYVTDINERNLAAASALGNVIVTDPEEIYDLDVDVYAPCALGATLNDNTIPRLKCSIIAGAANNQLKDEERHGQQLRDRGILYAPDFLINAGGLINCYAEIDQYNRERAMGYSEKIYHRTLEIYDLADVKNMTTHEAAVKVAKDRIASVAKLNATL